MNKHQFLLILIGAVLLGSCGNHTSSSTSSPSSSTISVPNEHTFFKAPSIGTKVYVVNGDLLSSQEFTLVSSLEGLLAKTNARIFIDHTVSKVSVAESHLPALQKYSSFETEKVDNIDYLLATFKNEVTGAKYALYDDLADVRTPRQNQSINYAASFSGAFGYLMVASSLESRVKGLGYSIGVDCTDITLAETFKQCKDTLSNAMIINQNPATPQLRDYSIASKSFCYYSDFLTGDEDKETSQEILNWSDKNAPILGWTENEVEFVSRNSLLGKQVIASDYCYNLSMYSAIGIDQLTQTKYKQRSIEPEAGKHYAAIMMSDGDNIQWMQQDFGFSQKYYGSSYRGEFPLTWTTAPSLYDLSPTILDSFYQTATAYDEFVAGPSGVGYINPSDYSSGEIESYAATTSYYMEKAGLSYLNAIDMAYDEDSIKPFAEQSAIKGGVLSIGDYYLEEEGSLHWLNDKPFVGVRDALWNSGNPSADAYYGYTERVAQRVKSYVKDPTRIEGYSIIEAHAWSIGSMQDIKRFVNQLNSDIVLVTVGELLSMIDANVPHVDVDVLDDIRPSDLDSELCPLESDPYVWDDIKNTKVNTNRETVFNSEKATSDWHFYTSGKEYDSASFVTGGPTGTGAILLNGSDLGNPDIYPNSTAYSAFDVDETYRYLSLYLYPSSDGDNAFVRLRALYENNGVKESICLDSPQYQGMANSDGYYLLSPSSPCRFNYDISSLAGRRVILSLEQDDSGEGAGEYVYFTKMIFANDIATGEGLDSWDIDQISEFWNKTGQVVRHNEGICLEVAGSTPSSISTTTKVPAEKPYLIYKVRKFVRSGVQDKNPQIYVYSGESLVKPLDSSLDYATVTGDNYTNIVYDFTAYAGKEIVLKIESKSGEHACIKKIFFNEADYE